MNDKEAFRQLVDEYKDKVVNTCFGFVHQKEDAEDIAQMCLSKHGSLIISSGANQVFPHGFTALL